MIEQQRGGSAQDALKSYLKYSRDPYAFLRDCTFTLDEVDSKTPIKRFPADLEYLQLFAYLFQQEKLLAVPKSRRMTMSWTCIALILWDTLFHEGRFSAFVSKKEDDAANLISRAEFIFNHIPEDKLPKDLLPTLVGGKMRQSPPALKFSFGKGKTSEIRGFPMTADALRQYGFSNLLGDEVAFWENAQKFYSAAKPTLDGGGRMLLISSRAPGFFKKVVFDQLDADTLQFPEIPPVEPKRPMPGVELWKNPKNGFLIYEVHYTANPQKRGRDWREETKKAMPLRDFLMEYEKSWQTFEGLPVFGDYNKTYHVSREELEPELGLPLLIGWDFGLTPAAVVGQLQNDRLFIFEEFIGQNIGIKRFCPEVMSKLKMKYSSWIDEERDFLHFVDPAGFGRSDTDESTCVGVMRELGLRNIKPGPMLWEKRKQAVEFWLLRNTGEGAGFLLNLKNTPTLQEGLAGGYRYPDKAGEIEPSKVRPLKDSYSHPADALQYLCAAAQTMLGSRERKRLIIPGPQYSFQGSGSRSEQEEKQEGREELRQRLTKLY